MVGLIDGWGLGDKINLVTSLVKNQAMIAVNVLRTQMKAEAVWLFGSQSRGEGGPDSDLDFLVVVPPTEEPRYRRAQRAHSLLRNLAVPKDVVVMTREEWNRESTSATSLASTVHREGYLLHGA